MRGRHSRLFATELPRLLPSEVLDSLIKRFKFFLRQEFRITMQKWLMAQNPGKHSRSMSDQSDSAVSSTASDLEDFDDEIATLRTEWFRTRPGHPFTG